MSFRSIFGAKRSPATSLTGAGQPSPTAISAHALRQLNRLCLNTRLQLGDPAGTRSSHRRKPAGEFREHRQYTPGDDVRYVDWKASARQEHIFIKQGEQQNAAVVYLLLDCSASMAWGSPPKTNAALSLAHALGYMALAHNDRLVIMPVNGSTTMGRPLDSLHPLGPLWGKGQAPVLSKYFQAVKFQGQVDMAQTLAGLGRRKISRGGLVLVISDLLGVQNLSAGLEALPAPLWNVVFLHLLHPQELSPELNGYFEMQDSETGEKKLYPVTPRVLKTYRQRLDAWRNEISQTCLERKAVYTMIPTHWSLENEILPQLRRDQVVKRL